jgi:hypothetical protein
MTAPAGPPDGRVPFPVTFSVSGSNPRVDLSLRAAEDGTFIVDVLTETSLGQRPPARLGAFRGRLQPETLERLAGVAAAARTAASAPPPELPLGSVVRLVSVGTEAAVVPVGEERDLAALDELVADAAIKALADPVAAVMVEARPSESGAEVAISASGTEAFRLLLYAADIAAYWVRVWADTPKGPAYLPYDDVVRLVTAGSIPEGTVELAPGETITIPLPPGVTRPGGTGGFIFWRAGHGPERRIVAGTWMLPAAEG